MRLFLILSLSLVVISSNHASIQKLTNPILPVNLKPSRIISSKHTFVTYLNISEFANLRNQLKSLLSFVITKKDIGPHTYNLIKQANTLLSYIDNSLEIIHPKRSKRGLINLGGKISKWLFGTLDAEDGKRIDLILNHLDKNDHLLQENINKQITLAKEIIIRANNSISQIKSNMLIITHTIDQFSERINEVNTLTLIINSLLILEIQLNQVIDAMTFANTNKIHPTFLSLSNLNSIITKIKGLYPPTQLAIFKNHYNYYSFLGIQFIFNNGTIIFLIHFPILMPLNFKTYFIYPVPIHNKIIPPYKPYLVLNERNVLHQYQSEPCDEVENVQYCPNHLQIEEDCVLSIIKENKPNNCTTVPVHMDKTITNQVTPHNVLLTTVKDISFTESCSVEQHHELSPGSYLITIPNDCHFTINEEMFTSGNEHISPAVVIQLPQLNLSLLPEHPKQVKLGSFDLEEIKHLADKLNTLHEVNVLEDSIPMGNKSMPIWIHILTYLAVATLVSSGVICYYRTCYPYPYQCENKKKIKKEALEMEEQP